MAIEDTWTSSRRGSRKKRRSALEKFAVMRGPSRFERGMVTHPEGMTAPAADLYLSRRDTGLAEDAAARAKADAERMYAPRMARAGVAGAELPIRTAEREERRLLRGEDITIEQREIDIPREAMDWELGYEERKELLKGQQYSNRIKRMFDIQKLEGGVTEKAATISTLLEKQITDLREMAKEASTAEEYRGYIREIDSLTRKQVGLISGEPSPPPRQPAEQPPYTQERFSQQYKDRADKDLVPIYALAEVVGGKTFLSEQEGSMGRRIVTRIKEILDSAPDAATKAEMKDTILGNKDIQSVLQYAPNLWKYILSPWPTKAPRLLTSKKYGLDKVATELLELLSE